MKANLIRSARVRRGAALLYATLISIVIAGMCLALLMTNLGTGKVRVQSQRAQRSFYAAEAGLSDAFMQLTEEVVPWPEDTALVLGSPDAPVALGTTGYWVEVDPLDAHSYSLTSTGVDGIGRERLELVVAEAPTGFFQYAAFGADGVVLDSNAFIDSFDSSLGSYDSQVQGGNEFAKENGHVGSNADILLKSNTQIHGDAIPGPDHVVIDDAPGAYVSGSTDPADEEFELVDIEVPVLPSEGAYSAAADLVLGPGEVHYSAITMTGGTQLTIVGPATVVVDDFLLKSNAELKFETAGGPVVLHGTGDFVLQSNSTVLTPTDSAVDVTMLLSGDNMTATPPAQVELSSNSQFVGAIYAPKVDFSLGSNFDIYGSIMCGFLDLSSNGEIHFDEALLYDGWGSTDEFEARLWRRLPPE